MILDNFISAKLQDEIAVCSRLLSANDVTSSKAFANWNFKFYHEKECANVDALNYLKRLRFAYHWPEDMLVEYAKVPENAALFALLTGEKHLLLADFSDNFIRSSVRILGFAKNHKWISSMQFLLNQTGDKIIAIGDAHIVLDPIPRQIAEIAGRCALAIKKVFAVIPNGNFISFATPENDHYRAKHIREASAVFCENFPNYPQAIVQNFEDALNKNVDALHYFVFPNIDASSVALGALTASGWKRLGILLSGLRHPVMLFERDVHPESIIFAIGFLSKIRRFNAKV